MRKELSKQEEKWDHWASYIFDKEKEAGFWIDEVESKRYTTNYELFLIKNILRNLSAEG